MLLFNLWELHYIESVSLELFGVDNQIEFNHAVYKLPIKENELQKSLILRTDNTTRPNIYDDHSGLYIYPI